MQQLIEWLEFLSNENYVYDYNSANCWNNRVNILLNGKVILTNYTIKEAINYLQMKSNI